MYIATLHGGKCVYSYYLKCIELAAANLNKNMFYRTASVTTTFLVLQDCLLGSGAAVLAAVCGGSEVSEQSSM